MQAEVCAVSGTVGVETVFVSSSLFTPLRVSKEETAGRRADIAQDIRVSASLDFVKVDGTKIIYGKVQDLVKMASIKETK